VSQLGWFDLSGATARAQVAGKAKPHGVAGKNLVPRGQRQEHRWQERQNHMELLERTLSRIPARIRAIVFRGGYSISLAIGVVDIPFRWP